MAQLGIGSEMNFVTPTKYNLAAYALAELLGVEILLPCMSNVNGKALRAR